MFAITLCDTLIEPGRIYITSIEAMRSASRRLGKDWFDRGYRISLFEGRCQCPCDCLRMSKYAGKKCDGCWDCKTIKTVNTRQPEFDFDV